MKLLIASVLIFSLNSTPELSAEDSSNVRFGESAGSGGLYIHIEGEKDRDDYYDRYPRRSYYRDDGIFFYFGRHFGLYPRYDRHRHHCQYKHGPCKYGKGHKYHSKYRGKKDHRRHDERKYKHIRRHKDHKKIHNHGKKYHRPSRH